MGPNEKAFLRKNDGFKVLTDHWQSFVEAVGLHMTRNSRTLSTATRRPQLLSRVGMFFRCLVNVLLSASITT